MKKFTSFIIMLIIAISLPAQQLENASFENWEDAGTVIDEPVKWSSIKTSDGPGLINDAAPVVWGQSTDAHTGSYSVELTNVLTIGTIIASGVVTNGRVHAEFDPSASYVFTDPSDDRWHMALTKRPDSVAVWVKYTPAVGDTAQVKVLLHTGEGSLPPTSENMANWVGYAQINIIETVDSWTRFTAPVTYMSPGNPEYVLTILTSGAGTLAVEGSVALFDDFELIYNPIGIAENELENNLLYTAGNTVFLDKLPQEFLKNATIEIINLNGSLIYSTPITSNHSITCNMNVTQGLYIVRVYGQSSNYTQKVLLK